MKLLDKLAFNQLIKIVTNFILAIIKIFMPNYNESEPRRRPLRDLLDKWIKK